MKKPLEGNRELNFRVSLARSTLQVDSTPTRDTVGKFATHLLAEMEQIAHLDNNKKSIAKDAAKAAQPDAKLKKIEEHSGEGKGWRAEKGNTPCKFFLTEEGCRKGQQCAWKHQVKETPEGVGHVERRTTMPTSALGPRRRETGIPRTASLAKPPASRNCNGKCQKWPCTQPSRGG